MKKNRLIEKLSFFGLLLIFRGLLDFFYVDLIVPFWGYSGYKLDFAFIKYIESWFLIILSFIGLRSRCRKPSDFFILIMLLGVLIPLSSIYGLSNESRPTIFLVFGAFFLIRILTKYLPWSFQLPIVRDGKKIAVGIALFFCSLTVLWFLARGGLNRFNLDLSKVYEFRRGPIQIDIGITAYFTTWTLKIFSIFLFAFSVFKGKFFSAFLVFLLQVFFFGVSSHKATLFHPGLVLLVYLSFKNSDKLGLIPLAYCIVSVFSYLATKIIGSLMYASLFIRRVFFDIAKNTFDYYEFFSSNPKVFWSDHILSAFIKYPYHINPARLIGEWQSTESSVNNTFLSTGYMHAGILGLIFYVVLFALLLRVLDRLSSNIPLWFGLAITTVPMFSLITSADFFTGLLTHGVIISSLFLWLAQSKKVKPSALENPPTFETCQLTSRFPR